MEINFSSPKQMSMILFGGFIKVKVKVPILNEFALHQQIKSGPNKGEYKYKNEEKEIRIIGFGLKPLKEWQTKTNYVYKTDDQVLNYLLNLLGGNQNKNDKYLKAYEFIKSLLEYRTISKIIGTYYEGTEKFIYDDSCVHQQLCHCGYEKGIGVGGGTGTGRLSCTSPNMQNQPS
jgi:DNA polymerase I-like protein with 3'-5' exonuclease and polymerase domains